MRLALERRPAGPAELLNASTVFSFWPEVLSNAKAFAHLNASGCLINKDLAPNGFAVSSDQRRCRALEARAEQLRISHEAHELSKTESALRGEQIC